MVRAMKHRLTSMKELERKDVPRNDVVVPGIVVPLESQQVSRIGFHPTRDHWTRNDTVSLASHPINTAALTPVVNIACHRVARQVYDGRVVRWGPDVHVAPIALVGTVHPQAPHGGVGSCKARAGEQHGAKEGGADESMRWVNEHRRSAV